MMLETPARKPDILEVIADLSNDEVRTPPWVANAILDLLPEHVWSDPNLRWLDPGSKTGVFPREIAKRLMVGLKDKIPDDQERLEHILKNQVFAVAITELTALMSRRTIYCSKRADSEFSTVRFDRPSGNVWLDRVEHTYAKGKCRECRAPEATMEKPGRDNHAYAFIHADGREKLAKEYEMRFDVIVGNPPYQMEGGGGGTNDMPLYNLFVDQARALNPRYIAMITPSRWMAGGRDLDDFRKRMLGDRRVRALIDFENAKDLFPSVGIHGGVCYFLWDRDNPGMCATTYQRNGATIGPAHRKLDEFDTLVRDPRALGILRKVLSRDDRSFTDLVSGDTPFGLATNFREYAQGVDPGKDELRLYANVGTKRVVGSLPRATITKNDHLIDSWKLLIPVAGSGRERERNGVDLVLGPRIVAGPGSVCTQTYLVAGPFESEAETWSVDSYVRTRFARFLLSLRKPAQHVFSNMYRWVPQQTWDREWRDEDLYAMYDITEEEQSYIAALIREMPA